jgi:hypothetical protein
MDWNIFEVDDVLDTKFRKRNKKTYKAETTENDI